MKFILLLFLSLLWRSILFSQIQTTVVISDKCTGANSLLPTTTYGSSTLVQAGRLPFLSSTFYTARTYVEFDLSGIPENAIITDAKLRLYPNSTSGIPVINIARITELWLENTVSWSNQPNYSISDLESYGVAEFGSSWLNGSVKSHVQKMVAGVYPNYGWMLYHHNETENAEKNYSFRSDDYAGTDFDPNLHISYYIPMSVSSAAITHESASGANDGSISPVLANGPGGTYSYQWFNSSGSMSGKTSLNLTGIPYGWYGLRVTSSVAGTDPFYYAFLVGTNCEDVSIEFNPGPYYVDDALLSGFPAYLQNNSGSNTTIRSESWTSGGIWYESRTLIGFRLYIDLLLQLGNADLIMHGNAHNPLNRPNDSELLLVTKYWDEKVVSWSANTTFSNTIFADAPPTSSTNQNSSIDIKNFWNYWKDNPGLNYGMLFKLDTYMNSYTRQQYHSSDVVNSSLHPKINFKISLFDEACVSYSEMKRKLDGGYSYAKKGKLKFTMDEDYAMDNSKYLPFKIYDKNHLVLESSDINGVIQNGSVSPLPLQFSDNRWTLDVSTIPGMTFGHYYILEVSNSKGDKRYLRFLYKN